MARNRPQPGGSAQSSPPSSSGGGGRKTNKKFLRTINPDIDLIRKRRDINDDADVHVVNNDYNDDDNVNNTATFDPLPEDDISFISNPHDGFISDNDGLIIDVLTTEETQKVSPTGEDVAHLFDKFINIGDGMDVEQSGDGNLTILESEFFPDTKSVMNDTNFNLTTSSDMDNIYEVTLMEDSVHVFTEVERANFSKSSEELPSSTLIPDTTLLREIVDSENDLKEPKIFISDEPSKITSGTKMNSSKEITKTEHGFSTLLEDLLDALFRDSPNQDLAETKIIDHTESTQDGLTESTEFTASTMSLEITDSDSSSPAPHNFTSTKDSIVNSTIFADVTNSLRKFDDTPEFTETSSTEKPINFEMLNYTFLKLDRFAKQNTSSKEARVSKNDSTEFFNSSPKKDLQELFKSEAAQITSPKMVDLEETASFGSDLGQPISFSKGAETSQPTGLPNEDHSETGIEESSLPFNFTKEEEFQRDFPNPLSIDHSQEEVDIVKLNQTKEATPGYKIISGYEEYYESKIADLIAMMKKGPSKEFLKKLEKKYRSRRPEAHVINSVESGPENFTSTTTISPKPVQHRVDIIQLPSGQDKMLVNVTISAENSESSDHVPLYVLSLELPRAGSESLSNNLKVELPRPPPKIPSPPPGGDCGCSCPCTDAIIASEDWVEEETEATIISFTATTEELEVQNTTTSTTTTTATTPILPTAMNNSRAENKSCIAPEPKILILEGYNCRITNKLLTTNSTNLIFLLKRIRYIFTRGLNFIIIK